MYMDHCGRVIGLLNSNLFNKLSSFKVHHQSAEWLYLILSRTGTGKILVQFLHQEAMGCGSEIQHAYMLQVLYSRKNIRKIIYSSIFGDSIHENIVGSQCLLPSTERLYGKTDIYFFFKRCSTVGVRISSSSVCKNKIAHKDNLANLINKGTQWNFSFLPCRCKSHCGQYCSIVNVLFVLFKHAEDAHLNMCT